MKNYFFGEKALSGYARQQINKDGELSYKGVIHLFGTKVPIYLSLEPEDKFVKGEKLYKVFTYLTPFPAKRLAKALRVPVMTASNARLKAIKHVATIIRKLGVVYEYQKRDEEKIERQACRICISNTEAVWKRRLREAVQRATQRQREICDRKVQRLLANRKRNKRKNN
jgi:hypothetical protein